MLSISFPEGKRRATLRFAHPKGNIITLELIGQLRQAAEDLGRMPNLRLVQLEADGADFSFGASVPEHAPSEIGRVLPEMHAMILDWLSLPMPTAALVRGRCLGGGFELAMACDFIFAADDAMFGLPEISLGVFPPIASVLLPKRVGAAAATSAILTGVSRPAAAWQALGLIELIAPVDRLADAADQWFEQTLAGKSAEALRHAITAVRGPLRDAVARELPVIERQYLQDAMASYDAREGIAAFLEKRRPTWQDR
jgi:cyclohexa-1,5-dienecarbonyl-CoA hydratase